MSEFSRETLINIIETDHVQCGEASALARMALAAMDSEPVALQPELAKVIYHFRDWNEGFPVERFKADYVISWMLANYPPAQPAPVVPELMVDWQENEFSAGWNACRAAMLQAGNSPAQSDCCPAQNHVSPEQNGDTPAQIQGWIPVSERMPEVGDIVLTAMEGVVNVGEMECSAANCRFFTSVISGRELPATYWMPLPAAPQEVKHG
ncbi:DUF551 domain-containing protein [Klebsiella grimontii]|uniref:DUF551 domain-containing protein n=1 Tax=Klebsiella grimontii TaxID=2058152 RepID=UPI00244B39BD|nr:DUF551 domain-containing protein [Klebsiella grimontii]MDG9851479.1 DUF551 domain-containing protein [Klebsiella grimontii]MDG9965622.1 DUF551 domain-containing protein [Klebsiella grimontii]